MDIPYPFPPRWALGPVAALLVAIPAGLLAFESYHDPNQNDTGYCSSCHPGFTSGRSDTLHAFHTGGDDPVTTNCSLCHTGSGRDNPFTLWSTGDSDDGLGCTGCHGRDYGETIVADYRDFPISGQQKNSGVGLRLHHAVSGITSCAGCHTDTETPHPENVIDPGSGNTTHYYLRGDVSLGGAPVDPSNNEVSANTYARFSEPGLDNDGDDLYNMSDPDSVADPDQLFLIKLESGGIELRWPTPSPDWILQDSSTEDLAGWTAMTQPAFTERQNGEWIVTVSGPLSVRQFYRLEKPDSAPEAAVVRKGKK
ncbi:MAG: cytochrome c3 family protein [Puniceicoccaceae bacterium]